MIDARIARRIVDEALELDPEAVSVLCGHRVVCNAELTGWDRV